MRLWIAFLFVLVLARPASAQFSGMPGCNLQTSGLCETDDILTGTDYENIRAYLASLSSASVHTDGANCSAGQYPLGVSAGNAVQSCTEDDDTPGAGDFGFLALTGDVTSAGLSTTIGANSVALGTDTTGNYAAGTAEAGAATTGDSATAFFSSGEIEDARIPATITRDSEVATQTFIASDPPGTCTQGNWHHQDSTTDRSCVCIATNTWRCWTSTAP